MSDLELAPISLGLEAALLEHLIIPASVETLHRSHFSADLIVQDDAQSRLTFRAFNYVMTYYRKYGEAPTADVLQAEVTEIEFEDVELLPIDYLIEAFRKRYSTNQMNEVLLRLAHDVHEDPLTVVRQGLTEFQQILKVTEDKRYEIDLADYEQRIESYEQRVADGSTVGITFGFKEVDRELGGIRKGGLYFVIGRPKRYKSWFLLKSAVEASIEYHRRACLFSLEMDEGEMMDRAMCMISGIPFPEFMKGGLSGSSVQTMRDEMKSVVGKKLTILHPPVGRRDVLSLRQIAAEHQAEVMYIDQLKYIESYRASANDPRYQQVEYVCEDLKEASHSIPCYVAAQFNREAANMDEMADLSKIGLSDSIGQTADMVLGLYMGKENTADQEHLTVEFGTIESRSFQHARWTIPIHLSRNSNFGTPKEKKREHRS